MAGAAQLFLLCCLLQGSLCQEWASFMPQSLQGLSGSCVMINCTFSILPTYDQYLDDTCVAIWTTGTLFGPTVFNSGLTGQSANENILQGNLTGNLRAKNCTTVFHNMSPKYNKKYYFRLDCNNALKFSFPTNGTTITMTDSLPKPVITPPSGEVEEGAPVRVECSAVAPCPLLPPALTWTPAIGDVKKNQQAVTSVMTFNASRLHNGQRLQCSALYSRQAGNTDLQYENNLTLRILYPPNNTWVSHSSPVIEGTSVNLTCNTDANPSADKFTWYKVDGDQVEAVGFHALLSTNVSEADSSFFCQVGNRYGSQNSSTTQIDVQFPPKGTTVIVQPDGPILEGVSVSLLCKSRANPPVTNYTWYKDDEKKVSGSSLNISNVDPSHRGHYRCEARNELGEGQSAATQLDIQFAPQILPSSSCVRNSSLIRCVCISQGNPLPSLFWELAGEAVNHSVIPTTEVPHGSLVKWSQIPLNYLDKDVSSLVCLSNNSVGSDRFVFNVSFTNTDLDSLGLHPLFLFIGFLVGAIGTMLVCGLMLLIFVRKGKIQPSTKKGSQDTSNVVVADGTRSSNVNVIYDNKAFLEENKEESLHYASVDFAKLKDDSRGKLGKEEPE